MQGRGGGAAQAFVAVVQVVEQGAGGSFAAAAAQRPQGALPHGRLRVSIRGQLAQPAHEAGIRQHGERLRRRLADGRPPGGQGRQQLIEEAAVLAQAHSGGEGEEDLHVFDAAQAVAHGLFGPVQRTLHQQQSGLALAVRVLVVVKHLVQMSQVRVRRGGRAAFAEQHPQAEQDGWNGLHALVPQGKMDVLLLPDRGGPGEHTGSVGK